MKSRQHPVIVSTLKQIRPKGTLLMARNLGSLAKIAFSSSLASKPVAEPSGPIVATVKTQVAMGLPFFPGN